MTYLNKDTPILFPSNHLRIHQIDIYVDFSKINIPFVVRCMQIRVNKIISFAVGLGKHLKSKCLEFPQNKS